MPVERCVPLCPPGPAWHPRPEPANRTQERVTAPGAPSRRGESNPPSSPSFRRRKRKTHRVHFLRQKEPFAYPSKDALASPTAGGRWVWGPRVPALEAGERAVSPGVAHRGSTLLDREDVRVLAEGRRVRGGGGSQAFCKVCMGPSEILNNLKTVTSVPGGPSEQQSDWVTTEQDAQAHTRDDVQCHLGSRQERATFGCGWGGSLVLCVWVSAPSVPTAGQKPRRTAREPSADRGSRGARHLNVLGGRCSRRRCPRSAPSWGGVCSHRRITASHSQRTAWDP